MANDTPINWLEMDDIREDVDAFKLMRNREDPRVTNVGSSLLFDSGTDLTITVRVDDPELAQAVLMSMYRPGGSLIPGLELTSFELNTLAAKNKKHSAQLREIADFLDQQNPNESGGVA